MLRWSASKAPQALYSFSFLVLPLIAIGILSRLMWPAASAPCVNGEQASYMLIADSWRSNLRVAFTDDEAHASIRIAIVDQPDLADFTFIDDETSISTDSCADTHAALRTVAISHQAPGGAPTIYLARKVAAPDYRLYVHSQKISMTQAAALFAASSLGGGQQPL